MGEAAPIMSPPPGADPITEATELPAFFNRKIEFHLARKPFNGFNSNGDKGGFQLETLNPSSVPANQNRGLEVQKGKSELVENHGLDPELLSFRINFRRIGAGLQNLGNTCFLNSVLQCLTYTEPLAAYLQSGKHQTSCRTAGFCALCAIQKHVSRALNSTGRILAPKDLVSNLRCISRSFRNARQEDAHEYMVNLLESMHKCCLPSGVPSESPSAYERSLVHKIFGGRLRSQVKCTQCSYCSNKFDPFLDLSLEINKADSLHKALTHFTAKEQLDGGERQYQCQQCKQKVRASKQLTIFKPPHVLTIHLKRFGSHVQGQKIDKKIVFGPTLDLKPFVTGTNDGDLKYTLYGVLVHAGWSTHSGHYYSFVRTSTGMWYSLDDNQVVQVNERKVLEQKAYMLFYFRDQRIPVPKKPVDVAPKANMVPSAIGNKTASNYNVGLKEAMQNGPIEGKSNVPCSRAAAEVDASNASAAVEALIKKAISVSGNLEPNEVMRTGPTERKSNTPCSQAAVQVEASNASASVEGLLNKAISMSNNGLVADKCPSLLRDAGNSTSMLLQKDLNGPIVNGGQCLKQTASSVKACDITLHTANDISVTVTVKSGTQKHVNASNFGDSNLNIHQFATKKDNSDSCTAPTSCNGGVDVKKPVMGTVDRPLNVNILGASEEVSTRATTDSQKNFDKEKSGVALQKTSRGIANGGVLPQSLDANSQEGISSKLCDNGNSVGLSTLDVGEIPRLPTTLKISSEKKALDKKPHLAVKKKLFKCHVTKMQLSTNIIFGKNFRLPKRKKQNRSRVCNLKNKNPGQEHSSNGNCNDLDLGPSSSESSKKLSRGLSACSQHKRKNGDNSVVTDVTESGDLLKKIDKEIRERVSQSSTPLSTEKKPQTGHSFASVDKRKDAHQNGFMSMLTRGLEDTAVPQWDDIKLPATGIFSESTGGESISIGYVADEWDEEYDRGKRKKVRTNKVDFGGPNPFQEIASKKTKRKGAKLESSSRNEPFRIMS